MKLLLGTRTLKLDFPTYHETNRNEKIYNTSHLLSIYWVASYHAYHFCHGQGTVMRNQLLEYEVI